VTCRPRRLAWLLAVLVWGGCDREQRGSAGAAASSAPARAAASPALPPAARSAPETAAPERREPVCQVVDAREALASDGTALRARAALEGGFVSVAPGGMVSVRHLKSGREFRIDGPARAAPCRSRELLTILPQGTLSASAAPAAHPVPPLSIAVSQGVIHHMAGTIRVTAAERTVTIDAQGGSGSFVPALDGAERLPLERVRKVLKAPPSRADALVERCEQAADRAAELARLVLAGDLPDAAPVGDRARRQLEARVRARARCAAALARAVGEEKTSPDLVTRVERAERRWQEIPARSD